MSDKIDNFINLVLDRMVIDDNLRKRIFQDLYSHICEALQNQSENEVLEMMGDPVKVACEFMDSIYENKSEVIERLIRERLKVNQLLAEYFEYRSKAQVGGLPLIHIKMRRHVKAKPGTAKGIIAIGNRAIGAVAVGKICCGGICLGTISFGVASIGLLSTGVIAFGSFSVGAIALGGFVLGLNAFGGFAMGLISGGGFVRGIVAMGGHTVGKYILNTPAASSGQINALIRHAYPHISQWILKIIMFFKFFYT